MLTKKQPRKLLSDDEPKIPDWKEVARRTGKMPQPHDVGSRGNIILNYANIASFPKWKMEKLEKEFGTGDVPFVSIPKEKLPLDAMLWNIAHGWRSFYDSRSALYDSRSVLDYPDGDSPQAMIARAYARENKISAFEQEVTDYAFDVVERISNASDELDRKDPNGKAPFKLFDLSDQITEDFNALDMELKERAWAKRLAGKDVVDYDETDKMLAWFLSDDENDKGGNSR